MRQSSGILLTTGDRWLLAERSQFVDNPLVWGVPGGGVPRDLSGAHLPNLPSACREFWEEMGAVVPPESYVLGRTMRDGRRKRWTTWVLHVPQHALRMGFAPNYETGEYGWVHPSQARRLPLHKGLRDTLGELEGMAVFQPQPVAQEHPAVQALLSGHDGHGPLSVDKQREIEAWLEQQMAPGASWQDRLPGGLADRRHPSQFDAQALRKGVQIELEHTRDRALALEIAMDHLTEHPDYYTMLEQAEKRLLRRRR